jgi:glutaredoxin
MRGGDAPMIGIIAAAGRRHRLIGLLAATPTLLGTAFADAQGLPEQSPQPCQTIEIYSREGCPHCALAHEWLDRLRQTHSQVIIVERDVHASRQAMDRFLDLNTRFGIDRPGVPAFLVCDRFLVGFDPEATPAAIEAMLRAREVPAASAPRIELPWIGPISVENLGLPLFTLGIGLIDGFNPCAMWVLLFLLALLVNLRSRRRMALIATTFVLVSGIVYFALMAAWLNVFLVAGYSRSVQIGLGLIALLIGAVHLKDGLTGPAGVSLRIPDVAKPGLYARMREVIYARNLGATLLAVVTLAIAVNVVELLCTAGLPALYTGILAQHSLTAPAYYGYMLLYNLAYIADDGLMVGIAVYSLSHRKLQAGSGRFLQVLSGATMVALGALLVAAPHWLF